MLLKYQRRMVISFGVILMLFVLILAHLYIIQLVHGNSLATQAMHMRSEEVTLEEYVRGEITDRNGIPLTGGYYANRLVIFPTLMDNKESTLKKLAFIIDEKPQKLLEEAQQGAFYITRSLAGNELKQLQSAGLPGVFLLPVYQRYGNDPLAVHLTGHLGAITSKEQYNTLQNKSNKYYHLGDMVGQSGLEYFYEQELKGDYAKRWARIPIDARGRVIGDLGLQVETADSDPGRRNVVTTTDLRIQRIVENIMDEHIEKGAVVVMQAGSGDILAMSSRPDYYPAPEQIARDLQKTPGDIFVDQSTSLLQPGSVFKVVLAAATLEKGITQENTLFYCAGADAEPIRCWKDEGHGYISFRDAFAESCNPTFVEIGHRLGAEAIIEYAKYFGLDTQNITGYPFKKDTRQDLELVGDEYNLANSSVGQGPVLVTPVQITAMMNTIASKGIFYTPRLVIGLSNDSGHMVKFITGPDPQRAIASDTAAQLRSLLREVVVSGVGRKAEVSGWGSAGKTGSAQVSGDNGPVNAWFTGYVPAENPRYIITVLVCDGKSGGETAAPIFRNLANQIMEVE